MQKHSQFFYIAHRGGLFYRPENSLAAFKYIQEQGIHWIETDIRLSKDDVPLLFHDERIALADDNFVALRNLTAEQLQQIDIGGGEVVPTLSELFEVIGDDMCLDIEIKELDATELTMKAVASYGLSSRVVITSFIPEALQYVKDHYPNVIRGLLFDRLTGGIIGKNSTIKAALLLGCEWIVPHHAKLSKSWVKNAQSEGLKVIPWTVNRLEDAQVYVNYGIDGIISDRPDYLREHLKF